MGEQKNIMEYETVALDDRGPAVVILDQTKLPGSAELIRLTSAQEIWDAIYYLKVRGAPAIGVAAAFGIYVRYLDSARPTAVNLSWALERMEQIVL